MNPFFPLRKEQEITIIQYLQLCHEGVLLPGETKSFFSPKMSIILPLYNDSQYFTMAIRSAENQTFRDVEIICVDDGSTDNSDYLLKRFQSEDPRIKIIKNEKNRGSLYSRIYGSLNAKGDYILFLNAKDAFSHPNALLNIYNNATKYNVELLHFQACGGVFDGVRTFGLPYLFFTFNPNNFNKKISQPELRDNYFARQKHCTGSTFVFDKCYSKKLIKKIADVIGKDTWEKNVSRTDDLILCFAAMRNADSFVMANEMAYWHWLDFEPNQKKEKEDNHVGVIGDKINDQEKIKKKFEEVILSKSKIFDMTENDPQAGEVRMVMLRDLEKPEMAFLLNRIGLLDSLMELYRRMLNWSYSNDDVKKSVTEGAKILLHYSDELKNKYSEFYDDEKYEFKDKEDK